MTGEDERFARAVQATYINSQKLEVGHPLWEWVRGLPKEYRLDEYELVDQSHTGIGWAERRVPALETPVPVSQRRSTCFDVESTEMREACVEPLRAYFDGAEVVLHEVRHQRSGYHTDLVYADVDRDALRERARMATSEEPLHDPLQRFRVWWYLRENGPMGPEEAYQHGRYSDASKNKRHTEWLLDHGYIGQTVTGHFVAITPPKIADLHAVELKLRDWETALEQAARANRFDGPDHLPDGRQERYGYADYRWVALDAGAIGRALENAAAFRERGVGLLAIGEGGAVVEHIPAAHEPREPYTRDRAYAESQVWNRVDLGELDAEPREGGPGTPTQPTLTAFEEVQS